MVDPDNKREEETIRQDVIANKFNETPDHLKYVSSVRTGRTLVFVGIGVILLGFFIFPALLITIGVGLIGGGVLRYAYGKHKHGEALERFQLAEHEAGIRQKNACQICGKKSPSLKLDHDQRTGQVRGLLCDNCNTAIRLLGDDLIGVERAYKYLTES